MVFISVRTQSPEKARKVTTIFRDTQINVMIFIVKANFIQFVLSNNKCNFVQS